MRLMYNGPLFTKSRPTLIRLSDTAAYATVSFVSFMKIPKRPVIQKTQEPCSYYWVPYLV